MHVFAYFNVIAVEMNFYNLPPAGSLTLIFMRATLGFQPHPLVSPHPQPFVLFCPQPFPTESIVRPVNPENPDPTKAGVWHKLYLNL